jgi:hypothetical protein
VSDQAAVQIQPAANEVSHVSREQILAWEQVFTLLTGIDSRNEAQVRAWQAAHGVPATGHVRSKTIAAAWEQTPNLDRRLMRPSFNSSPLPVRHRTLRNAYAGGDDMQLLEPTFRSTVYHAPRSRHTDGPEDDFQLLEPDFSAPAVHPIALARNPYTGDADLLLLEPSFIGEPPAPLRGRRAPVEPPLIDGEEDGKLLRRSPGR